MNALIKEKKHQLYWGWHRKLSTYLLDYLSLPKLLILIALTTPIYSLVMTAHDPKAIIDKITITTIVLYACGLSYFCYLMYKKTISFPPPLIVSEAYDKTIAGIPMIPFFLLDAWEHFIIEETFLRMLLFSFSLAICLILMHAFFFVFRRQLKKETMEYYQFLNLV